MGYSCPVTNLQAAVPVKKAPFVDAYIAPYLDAFREPDCNAILDSHGPKLFHEYLEYKCAKRIEQRRGQVFYYAIDCEIYAGTYYFQQAVLR